MSGFDLTAIFLVIIGAAGWLNVRFLHLPTATVMVIAGLVGGGGLSLARFVLPEPNVASDFVRTLWTVDFPKTVLGYMLAFLLFAGAMQVSAAELRRRAVSIFTLATVGVLTSTAIVGVGIWLAAGRLGLDLPLPFAIVFGALISPTDPIAVLAAVREGNLSKTLEAVLQGEALFNDGVGIVVFTAAAALAASGAHPDPLQVIAHVTGEAVGGLVLGAITSFVAILAVRAIDDYGVEVGITIALAAGAYALAGTLGVSGPIAVVVAGMMVGNYGVHTAMSESSQRYIKGFWTLVDDVLNALLFLLLGLEMLVVPFDLAHAGLWLLAVLLVFAARFLIVLPVGAFFQLRQGQRGASVLLAWGGLHGALSLALALSLPRSEARDIILSCTFAVVIVSVLGQGLTFGKLAQRLAPQPAA